MLIRDYKDWKVRIEKNVSNLYGEGYAVEFFVPKENGVKERLHTLGVYPRKEKPMEIFEKVKKIINVL